MLKLCSRIVRDIHKGRLQSVLCHTRRPYPKPPSHWRFPYSERSPDSERFPNSHGNLGYEDVTDLEIEMFMMCLEEKKKTANLLAYRTDRNRSSIIVMGDESPVKQALVTELTTNNDESNYEGSLKAHGFNLNDYGIGPNPNVEVLLGYDGTVRHESIHNDNRKGVRADGLKFVSIGTESIGPYSSITMHDMMDFKDEKVGKIIGLIGICINEGSYDMLEFYEEIYKINDLGIFDSTLSIIWDIETGSRLFLHYYI